MPLFRLADVSIAFGVNALLDKANFQIDAGERVGLIGRNGEGKSTLMKIINGDIPPDSGEVWRQPALRMARLEQAPERPAASTVYDAVASGLGDIGRLIAEYHAVSRKTSSDSGKHLETLGRLQHELESRHGWEMQQRVETVLSRLDLSGDQPVSGLSGGWQRRVALATALVSDPELLLLDEPTNHLDLETIIWLEEQLLNFPGAILFVTHDRAFLQKLATRIVDLDRGQLVSWPGDYSNYLRKKAESLEEEANRNAEFDKKLAQEEAWIRQGIKARRTRNEGRVRALKKLREERAQRRMRQGNAKLALDRGALSGKLVIEAENVHFSYGASPIVSDFSLTLVRGDKVGLIGPNGCGKSTLLQLLLKQLAPNAGTVSHGTRLDIAYFDQLRAQLDPEKTVVDTVGDGGDHVTVAGTRRHVMSYLGDFLFAPARARSPIKSLSGGEKNRVLLARLFSKPANLLVMDEPTNDLDLETLELLEDLLVSYDGTLLLVSHDREFLDNVVTSVLVFEGNERVNEYVGGYSDWLRQRTPFEQQPEIVQPAKPLQAKKKPERPKKKLSFKEQQELDALPETIEKLETRQADLNERIAAPDFFQGDKDFIATTLDQLKSLEAELERSYERWNELESLAEEYAR